MINKRSNNKFQITNYKFLFVIALFTYLLISLFTHSTRVRAQQVLPLTVVPPKQEVLINPGENFETSVKFLNQGDSPVSGTLSVVDFVVTDDKGTPVFLDSPQVTGVTAIAAKYSAAKWIKLTQSTITISAKDNVAVPVSIDVPKNAAPGGRYAAIIFEPGGSLTLGNPTSAQEQAISVRMASLVYIRVAGPISEGANVSQFQAPGFLEYGPVSVATQITNEGDYHITPQGTITLKDMFGKTVSKVDLDSKNIFPGTSRDYTTNIGSKLMIGEFTAVLSATYGDTGKTLSSALTLWVFPWKLALAILLGIVVIILVVVLWYKKVTKKEEKLVEELKEEKTELETLKEALKDKITGTETPKTPEPPKGKTA